MPKQRIKISKQDKKSLETDMIRIIESSYNSGNYQTALKEFQALDKQFRYHPEIKTNIGATFYKLGDFENAKKSYKKAIQYQSEISKKQLPQAKKGLSYTKLKMHFNKERPKEESNIIDWLDKIVEGNELLSAGINTDMFDLTNVIGSFQGPLANCDD